MFTNGTELRQVIRKNVNLCRIRECSDYDVHGSKKYYYAYLYGDFDFENYYTHQYGEIFDKVYGLPIGEIYVISSLPRDWLDNDAKQVMLFRLCNEKIKTQEDFNNYRRIKEKIKSEETFMCEYEAITYENSIACTINLYI